MSSDAHEAAAEQRARAALAAARRLAAAPRPVPLALRAWALGQAVLLAADEESTSWGLLVGGLATLAPELAGFLLDLALDPFVVLYVVGLLGLSRLLVRDLPSGVRSGWADMRVLARGDAMLADGEPLRRVKRRRRESGRTPRVAIGLARDRIEIETLERVADIDAQGHYRVRLRVIAAPLQASAMVGCAAVFLAIALMRMLSAIMRLLA